MVYTRCLEGLPNHNCGACVFPRMTLGALRLVWALIRNPPLPIASPSSTTSKQRPILQIHLEKILGPMPGTRRKSLAFILAHTEQARKLRNDSPLSLKLHIVEEPSCRTRRSSNVQAATATHKAPSAYAIMAPHETHKMAVGSLSEPCGTQQTLQLSQLPATKPTLDPKLPAQSAGSKPASLKLLELRRHPLSLHAT